MRLKPITYLYIFLSSDILAASRCIRRRSRRGLEGAIWTPGAPPHEQVCWTYLNSLPGYADGTSPSNWLNDKGVARPGCFLWKPITHTCAFRRASKTAPDVVKGSPNPGCSLERKLSQKRNLDSTSPKGTRPGTFPRQQ